MIASACHARGRPPARDPTPLRLDIGGAAVPYAPDEYTTVDLYGEPDVRADALDLPFATTRVDAIWASHVLEHLAIARCPWRWPSVPGPQAPGGRAIIRVPNFDYVAKYWLTGPTAAGPRRWCSASRPSEGEFHKRLHDRHPPRRPRGRRLRGAPRVEMRWTHNQETLQAVARKPSAVLTPQEAESYHA
jgi:hypothetical protein